ncbi:MAG TPA: sigma 54-dependent Fis family transcriptional regulator [Polyangiaceae bacterium]
MGTTRAALPEWPVRTLRVRVVDGPDAGKSVTSEDDRMTIGAAADCGLVVADRMVSRYHVEVTASTQGIRVRDMGSTNGVFVGALRVADAVVPPATRLLLGATTVEIDDGSRALVALHEETSLGGLLGTSLPMRRAMAKLAKVAGSNASVLLVGESGTGKELAARALHDASPRSAQPFEVVDCAALVPTLVASELFGHERGAFTGADRAHEGAFERAQGGTVFLDEIGELPRDVQPQLLGALERRRVRRLGARADVPIDVRVVSATHRDLRAEVNASAFRLDLYYRVAVVLVELPPLRDRRGDVRPLVEHFLREAGVTDVPEKALPAGFLEALAAHHFPGNVRELRNLVEAALATGESPSPVRAPHGAGNGATAESSNEATYGDARDAVLSAFEARYLPELLERAEGNVSKAARVASMDRSHLIHLLQKHGLRPGRG